MDAYPLDAVVLLLALAALVTLVVGAAVRAVWRRPDGPVVVVAVAVVAAVALALAGAR